MSCQCGSGYCSDDNVVYPCVCDEQTRIEKEEEFQELVEEFFLIEEDDLPFQVSIFFSFLTENNFFEYKIYEILI